MPAPIDSPAFADFENSAANIHKTMWADVDGAALVAGDNDVLRAMIEDTTGDNPVAAGVPGSGYLREDMAHAKLAQALDLSGDGTPDPPATGATAGTPGSFTPAGCYQPRNLAGMAGVVADPGTNWAGPYVVCYDNAKVRWTGTAWGAAVPATGATAGDPGTFTPAAAFTPANLAALATVTADPLTRWAFDQNVVLGDSSTAWWNGAAWVAGTALSLVPDVVGMSTSAASAALVAVGLTLGTSTPTESTVANDAKVVSQDPAAATDATPGTAVDYGLGVAPVVPNIVGMTASAADAALVAAGLTVGTVTTASGTLDEVLSQGVAAASKQDPGTAVGYVKGDGA